ncbi:MAG TPA: hypothetical protein VKA46_17470 [Gemmataceae bacterium]|nr:hypothetical protein [Gemmataceae bacterium]
MNENREFVWRRLTEGFSVGGHEVQGRAWLIVLLAILSVGVVYVIWMYVRDGHSIGWFWGTFLAALRLAVYGTLAVVFLLPAYQNWEETRQQSKVVVTFDVTGSMGKQDDPVVPGLAPEKRPTRQDKVLAFLGEPSAPDGFFKRLQKTNPVTMYRWGAYLDDDYLVIRDGQLWDRKAWEEGMHDPGKQLAPGQVFAADTLSGFLKPDLKAEPPEDANDEAKNAFRERKEKLERLVKSTNVGQSALDVLSKEINNMPQGIVIFTDCRSTEGGPQAFKDLAERAKRAKVPVFVVVVGEDRPETRIEVVDVRGPDKARPEDPFPIAVDITGVGLNDRTITVSLDIFKPGTDPKKDQPFKTVEKQVTFKGTQLPRAQVEFPITPAEYGDIPTDEPATTKPGEKPSEKPKPPEEKSTKPEFKVGDWSFVPRVARDPAEINNEKFHTKEPAIVKIEKKALRVLLFASAPLRDYQFVRTMLVRESDKKRLELSIYLQPLPGQARRNGIVQDVPPDRMLTRFPDKLDDKKQSEDEHYNLANYDVIVAFDPNWTELTKEQTALLDRWVSQQGGGLIVVGGPIHTVELALTAAHFKAAGGDRDKLKRLLADNAEVAKLKPILDLYPVVLKDIRLEKDRNTAIPAGLHFTNATPEMEFLKLDEEDEKTSLLDAWTEFFRGKGATTDSRLLRGFYGFYPVEKAKDTAITVATFKDETSTDKVEPPYLVIMPNYGAGRLVWLGSGETWRLRQYREVWHERFWTKLVRYASAGSTGKTTRRIIPAVGRQFAAGAFFDVPGQFFGKDLLPLGKDVHPKPKVILRPPVGVADVKTEFEMAPMATGGGDWDGRFSTRLLLKSPGEYGLTLKIDEPDGPTSDLKIKILETDTELENTRPDLAAAYELASDAEAVLERLDDSGKKLQLKQALQRFMVVEKGSGNEKERLRLVFDLRSAALIPDCMKTLVNKQESRGKVDDIWDQGLPLANVLYWFSIVTGVIAGFLAVVALVLFAGGKQATGMLIGTAMVAALAVAALGGRFYLSAHPEITFSVVLGIVVGLLSVEWLTRKLLRLA